MHAPIIDLTSQCRAARQFDIAATPAPYPAPWHVEITRYGSVRIVAADSAIVADMFGWDCDPGVMDAARKIAAAGGK